MPSVVVPIGGFGGFGMASPLYHSPYHYSGFSALNAIMFMALFASAAVLLFRYARSRSEGALAWLPVLRFRDRFIQT